MSRPTIVQKPTLAIVGRTNVGKSTLFNRLIEEAKALISPQAGTTRSPNYGDAIWCGRVFTAVDTGGLDKRSDNLFAEDISAHATRAMEESDVILFLIDLKVGVTPHDRELAKILRKISKPILLVGNKAENEQTRRKAKETWRALGLGELHTISAATGMGVGDLLDAAFAALKTLGIVPPTVEEELKPIKVAIIGKPNVGKSSLLNSLVGAPRAVVSEIAHTTREPQDTLVRVDDQLILFIDTAGIRRKLVHAPGLTAAGIKKSLEAIRRADIVLVVLDLADEVAAEDKHLAGVPLEESKGIIIVGNKWDLVQDKKPEMMTGFTDWIHRMFPFIAWAPVQLLSAKAGKHVTHLYDLIAQVTAARKREITDNALDKFFRRAITEHRPSRGKGVAHPYIYSMKQTGVEPPYFVISVKGTRDSVHPSYMRFLENRLREKFDFTGTPIVIEAKVIRPHI